ncbi:hypothetical protein PAHAL_8G052000 [Panicum hallii]|uniref:Peptide N-acetyl-beta-D-glucosaminyl asparaginase amidase A N-terminal domain-containing protein n=1 Tax=Panicum hallii TaxID=206008 RepID=A0A2T8I7R0_9POAL|nr:hypothetical protein PAHAL_8G052000 [Panicum hallii]PVH33711.1 hypothetical protein PAHAL_8G052000 [Panicum hallii]
MRPCRSTSTPPTRPRVPRRRRHPASCRCSPTPSPTRQHLRRAPRHGRIRAARGVPAPWSLVVLSSVAIVGDQYDRVAAVWLDGAELLRTTTVEPTPNSIRWTAQGREPPLRADPLPACSPSCLRTSSTTSTPACTTSASPSSSTASRLTSRTRDPPPPTPTLPESYFQPADLILPISEATDSSIGFWFRIQNSSGSRSKLVSVPSSTYHAVLSRSASSRADLACVAGAGQAGHGLSAVSSKPSADMVVRCRCCDIRRVLAPQLQRHRAGRKPVYSITRSMRRMRACQGRLPQLHVEVLRTAS